MKRLQMLAYVLAGVAGVACGGQGGQTGEAGKVEITEAEKDQVVAKIGDQVITLKDFEARLSDQAPFARARFSSIQRKQEFLDSLVRFEVLAKEAEAKGYDKDPDVQLARKQAMVRKLMADEVPNLAKLSDITDDETAKYYQEHIEEFDRPAEVRAAHLLVKNEASARKLLAEIQAKIGDKKQDARDIFGEYVRQHSEDPTTRESGGDLQFFGRPGAVAAGAQAGAAPAKPDRGPLQPEVPVAVAEAVWQLDAVGEIAPSPVQAADGWHIVQKTGFKRAYKRELADVKQTIRNKLFRSRKTQALEKYVTDLKAKVKIEIDDRVLESAKAPPPGPEPALAPPTAVPGMGLPGFDPAQVLKGLGAAGGPPGLKDPADPAEAATDAPESKP